uniref:Uncharacterized protein n=1 Tax=Cyprinus carpio TaxID=7962 RepID=A0A8C1QDL9_CYPCA
MTFFFLLLKTKKQCSYKITCIYFSYCKFKEKSPFCVECGLQLAEKSQTAVVRHFGLQILEHVVK